MEFKFWHFCAIVSFTCLLAVLFGPSDRVTFASNIGLLATIGAAVSIFIFDK